MSKNTLNSYLNFIAVVAVSFSRSPSFAFSPTTLAAARLEEVMSAQSSKKGRQSKSTTFFDE